MIEQIDIDDVRQVVDSLVELLPARQTLTLSRERLLSQTQIQTIFGLKYDTFAKQCIHEVVMNNALAAEKLGPGAFVMCINRCQQLLCGQSLSDVTNVIHANAPRASDVRWVMDRVGLSDALHVREIVERAVALAGFRGRIIVEKTSSRDCSIELVDGHTFDLQSTITRSFDVQRPRIICIDGYVETVSELHRLLEGAAAEKTPVVLFVRGLSDDVKHTIKVNIDRGTLCVIPIVVKFDLHGINTLNDIAVVSGCDITSSHKGDLISTIDMSSGALVDRVMVDNDRVVIVNNKTRDRVQVHVATLRIKRDSEEVDDVKKLLDIRIRSLSPRHVIIRVTDDRRHVIVSQMIDSALRAFRALVDHGTVIGPEGKELASTYWAAARYSRRCVNQLQNVAAVIKVA